MKDWAITFFYMAMVAAMLGFTEMTGPVIENAKVFFFVLLALSMVMFILGKKFSVAKQPSKINSRYEYQQKIKVN